MLASMIDDVTNSGRGGRSNVVWSWIEGVLEILSGLLEFGLELLL